MRAKLGTQRELASLAAAADYCDKQGLPFARELRKLYDKLTKPKVKAPGAPINAIEAALVAYSNGLVLAADGGPIYFGKYSNLYGAMGATPEQAVMVAEWMTKQPWLRSHRYTLDSLYHKWPNYLAQAQAADTSKEPGDHEWVRPEAD